jgi:hypothetical protein
LSTIGDTGAPSTNTLYYDSLLSTTLMAYRKTLVDNIFKDSAVLAYLRMTDSVKKQNGGERVAQPLMYGKNQTIKTVGGYEVLDTTPQEGFTTAFMEWAEIGGTISISRKEERQNTGEGRLINLLESKIKQAEMSMREELNAQIVLGTVSSACFVQGQSSAGSYGIAPLGYWFRKLNATDPLTNNPGNIASATYSWWRHRTADFGNNVVTGQDFRMSVTTWAGLETALKRVYNYASRGSGGSPDLVIFDQVSFEEYESSQNSKVRYLNTKMADMGFDTIKLKGATCLWDEKVPDIYTGTAAITVGTGFFLNTNFYNLVIDSETDIVTTPFVEPENQTAKTAKILFMGNSLVTNMRKHAVAMSISQTIVS